MHSGRDTHSQSGRSTNSLSSMSMCGICSLSSRYVKSSYSRMSRSMFLGPLSITLTRPILFSTAWSSFSSSIGDNEVSICACQIAVYTFARSTTYFACTIHKLVLVKNIHGLCFPQTTGPQYFNLATSFHLSTGLLDHGDPVAQIAP